MSVSPTEIRDRAANDLGLLVVGGTLQAQHAARISQGYAEVYANLLKDGLAIWAFANDVPDTHAPYVIALVAENCLNTYSVSNDRYTRIKNAASVAPVKIQAASIPNYISTTTPENF